MSELNTKDLNPEVWKLFDRYVHGLIDRRGFLDGTAKYAVGGMTAVLLSTLLVPTLYCTLAESRLKKQSRNTT